MRRSHRARIENFATRGSAPCKFIAIIAGMPAAQIAAARCRGRHRRRQQRERRFEYAKMHDSCPSFSGTKDKERENELSIHGRYAEPLTRYAV
jgi:hypothetical protein